MKIIITHRKVKREINGPFDLCGDSRLLRDIAEQILAQTEQLSYGWISIVDPETRPAILANTPPISWEADGATQQQRSSE